MFASASLQPPWLLALGIRCTLIFEAVRTLMDFTAIKKKKLVISSSSQKLSQLMRSPLSFLDLTGICSICIGAWPLILLLSFSILASDRMLSRLMSSTLPSGSVSVEVEWEGVAILKVRQLRWMVSRHCSWI